MENGRIKAISGIRGYGKAALLFKQFKRRLMDDGVAGRQFIELELDDDANARHRNPFELDKHVRQRLKGAPGMHYYLIDEIQLVEAVLNPCLSAPGPWITFAGVLLSLMKLPNVGVYVTGSLSRMPSSDVPTNFRHSADNV